MNVSEWCEKGVLVSALVSLNWPLDALKYLGRVWWGNNVLRLDVHAQGRRDMLLDGLFNQTRTKKIRNRNNA
jgi:hypothetical protein